MIPAPTMTTSAFTYAALLHSLSIQGTTYPALPQLKMGGIVGTPQTPPGETPAPLNRRYLGTSQTPVGSIPCTPFCQNGSYQVDISYIMCASGFTGARPL